MDRLLMGWRSGSRMRLSFLSLLSTALVSVTAVLVLCQLALAAPVSATSAGLPRVVSTNLCADILALSLADPRQLLSVSRKSQDASLSSMPQQAQRFPANDSTAEEIMQLRPDIVLASRRWQARNLASEFERLGIRILVVPYPVNWQDIFATTQMIGAQLQRADAATALVTHVQQRLARLHDTPRPYSALYLRPNGGSAGTGTYVDAVFAAAGLRNHAADQGQNGWGRFALETLVARPPDLFVFSDFIRDTAYSRSGFGRHPLLQNLLQQRPVISLAGKYWGCGNWQLIEAAEDIAAQIDRLVPASAPEVWL